MDTRLTTTVAMVVLPSLTAALSRPALKLVADGDSARAATASAPARAAGNTAGSAAATIAGAGVQLTETDTLRVAVDRGNTRTFSAVLFARNDSGWPVTLTCARVVLRDSSSSTALDSAVLGCQRKAANTERTTIVAFRLTPIRLNVTLPGTGTYQVGSIVLGFDDSTNTKPFFARSRAIRVSTRPRIPSSEYADNLIVLPALLAIVAAIVATAAILDRVWMKNEPVPDTAPTQPPGWDPSTSWASNLGVAGGIVTVLLGLTLLPDQPRYLAKSGYTLLSALFAAVIGMAPSVYAFLRRTGNNSTLFSTAIISAATVTLWGAFGQLIIAIALFGEFERPQLLPHTGTLWVQAFLVLVGLALFVYAIRSIIDSVVTEKPAEAPERAAVQDTTVRQWKLL
jgi:hypothetical protein